MKIPLPPRTTLLGLLIASIVGWGCATTSFHFSTANVSKDRLKAGDLNLVMDNQKRSAESFLPSQNSLGKGDQ
jgi:CRISPR/Cas system-associated protein Cas5 (RAMP superfamily)